MSSEKYKNVSNPHVISGPQLNSNMTLKVEGQHRILSNVKCNDLNIYKCVHGRRNNFLASPEAKILKKGVNLQICFKFNFLVQKLVQFHHKLYAVV